MTTTRQTLISLLAGLLCLTAGCLVDTGIPRDAKLTCQTEGECPEGWTCNPDQKRCLPPGGEADGDGEAGEEGEAIHREQDKAEACGAIYDKAGQCETEVSAMLGGEAAVFDADRTTFIEQRCVPGLFSGIGDSDLDTLMTSLGLIAAIGCDLFAAQLCPLFPAEKGYSTNCP